MEGILFNTFIFNELEDLLKHIAFLNKNYDLYKLEVTHSIAEEKWILSIWYDIEVPL